MENKFITAKEVRAKMNAIKKKQFNKVTTNFFENTQKQINEAIKKHTDDKISWTKNWLTIEIQANDSKLLIHEDAMRLIKGDIWTIGEQLKDAGYKVKIKKPKLGMTFPYNLYRNLQYKIIPDKRK